jgi:hypothetical protein
MPRPRRVPAYALHKPSGQARVILDGRHIDIGPHGSAASREKYSRLISERFVAGPRTPSSARFRTASPSS